MDSYLNMDKQIKLICLVMNALSVDGAHHKQWYLHKIAEELNIDYDKNDFDEGIAP